MDFQEEILLLKKNILLGKAQQAQSGEQTEPTEPTRTKIIIRVAHDKMEASLLLHPTSPNTAPPLREEILAALEEHGIVYGVNMELLEDLCVKPVYYHAFVIARGKPAGKGKDGYLNYLVSLVVDHKPVIKEDGTADYKNIDFFRVVRKDQKLCEVYPPETGEDGTNILGEALEGITGRDPLDPAGLNTYYNEEKSALFAAIDGHVTIQRGIVNIVEVLTIRGGINNETGNISFSGDVVVQGDVASGFSIQCGGSIIIHGSVEGAMLKCGTDISVSTGMFGMDKGRVYAGGNIKCKFIQNCTVMVAGNIYAESILFCDVKCHGDIFLSGRKGALIGGHTAVAGKITAKTIGTPLHVLTTIEMCALDADKDHRLKDLQRQSKICDEEITRLLQMLARYEDQKKRGRLAPGQIGEVTAAMERYKLLLAQRDGVEAEANQIRLDQQEDGREKSYIECKGNVHVNTRISFGGLIHTVEDTYTNCRITASDNEVRVMCL